MLDPYRSRFDPLEVLLDNIFPNAHVIRRVMDEQGLQSLVHSIQTEGLHVPPQAHEPENPRWARIPLLPGGVIMLTRAMRPTADTWLGHSCCSQTN
jgi:hypothetical protein